MSVQPVEISGRPIVLCRSGPPPAISAKYDGVGNVMTAAWVGAGMASAVAYIAGAFTLGSAGGKERLFRGADPRSQPDGNRPSRWRGAAMPDAPDKNDTIPFFISAGI